MIEREPAAFRTRLRNREPLLGTMLTLPSPEIAEIFVEAGFDWLFIDMEHGLLEQTSVQRIVQAVAERCPCIVRVPGNDPVWIARVLDTGASGLIVPHVNRAEDAHAALRAAKYPPQGDRSIGPTRAMGYGSHVRKILERGDQETVFVAQAEHIDAVRNVDGILSVPGLDSLFVGPFDLSASMGKPGNIGDPEVQEAIRSVTAACAAHQVPAGIFVVGAEAARAAFTEGISLVCASSETLLLSRAARNLITEAKQ